MLKNGKRKMSGNISEKPLSKIQIIDETTSMNTQCSESEDYIGKSWLPLLSNEFKKPYFQKLSKFIYEERKKNMIYPKISDVYTWTQFAPIEETKVVIIGQDPYHGPDQAHGLCFSVPKKVAIPPSLENMYKELKTNIDNFNHPGHGNLIGWSNQGVLLLNSVLTVRQGEPNSHKNKGWERFTDNIVSYLNCNLTSIVFILWGAYAQKKGQNINKVKHLVLEGVHPSPLSSHRGFFGCKHFSMCNEYLLKNNKAQILWNELT